MKKGEAPSLAPPYDRYVLLARLLPAIAGAGMTVSPDRLIRLQRLLDALPPDAPAGALGPWITPLFATDPLQQERFATLMAQALQPLHGEPEGEKPEKADKGPTSAPPPTTAPSKPDSPKQRPERAPSDTLYAVDLEQCDEPPYSWSIAPREEIPIAEGSEHGRTLARLRSREASDLRALDWPATLHATIAQAGMPALRYRARTRPVEYLLLVERFSADDHRALLFDRLFQNLRRQDVLIERYFHDGDPRRCYNERHPSGIPLREVRYRHAHARLLFMGNGYRLLSPETGRLADWAKNILPGWNTRLLLTPLARPRWGLREFQLKNLFLLLPADWEALRYAAEYPQPDQNLRYAELPDYVREAAERPQGPLEPPYLPDLRAQLPEHLLLWTAACAVWPALHFDLTLQLGRLLGDDNHNLLRYDYLARLAALPWFANGYIPKDARRELLEYLDAEYPNVLQRCAAHLLDLLRQNPPDNPRSHAAAEHTLYIALLQALAAPQPDETALTRLRAVLRRLRRKAILTDFVLPPSIAAQLQLPDAEPNEDDPSPPAEFPLPDMILVKGGSFEMGSEDGDSEAYDYERPRHRVTLGDFEMGKTAVTVAQYMAFVEDTQTHYPEWLEKGSKYNILTGTDNHYKKLGDSLQAPDNPIVGINWVDAKAYCAWLSRKTGKTYRLPTEAEWEYAARGGEAGAKDGYKYAGSNDIDEVAWYTQNTKDTGTRPVATKKKNQLGLYDMSGNVWEWCEDDWHSDYKGAPADGRAWVNSPRGDTRVYRGGSWLSGAQSCRVANRYSSHGPSFRDDYVGFRLVRSFQSDGLFTPAFP